MRYSDSPAKFTSVHDTVVQSTQQMLHYLAPLCDEVESLMEQYYTQDVQQWRTIREVLLVCFMLVLLLSYLCLFKPAISQLEKKKQQTRSMLLIIPARAMAIAESLRKAVADLVLH